MPSVNDNISNRLTGYDVDVLRVEAGMVEAMLKKFEAIGGDLVSKLRHSDLDGTEAYSRRAVNELLRDVKQAVRSHYAGLSVHTQTSLEQLTMLAEKQAIAAINLSLGAVVLKSKLSEKVIKAIAKDTLVIGAIPAEWWSRQGADLMQKFADIVRSGMASGLTNQQIVRRVMGTKAGNYKDGLMQIARHKATALVRTSVQAIANEGRLRAYANNDDLVKGVQWLSTLDNRTSDVCKGLSGLQWDTDFKPAGHKIPFPGPTAHFNCRSSQTAILKSWEELGGNPKAKEIPKTTQSSMDGQVSQSINYETWLSRQPIERQRDNLGPTKFKLWKAGKLSFTDLINQSGNPTTAKELLKKFT